MLLYSTGSWHYRLILWTWGKHFFEKSHLDMEALRNIKGDDLMKMHYDQLPVKWEAKTTNFCPYCRALVGSIICAPFVYLKRLKYPYKEKKNQTRADIMKASSRRTFVSLVFAGSINYAVGIYQMIRDESIIVGIPSIAIGTILIIIFTKREWLGKHFIKSFDWLARNLPKIKWPKWERKKKVKKAKTPRKPSKIGQKIHEKHDLICPPVYFVEKKSDEDLK